MEAAFRVPCRGLLPSDLAEVVERGGLGGGASVSVAPEQYAPTLSDRIVTIEGDATELEQTFRLVLERLREADAVKEAAPALLFVAIVPPSAAAAVVGTRGQKVQALIKRSGAAVEVKREILPGLGQPVIVRGTPEQVLVGTLGVVEVLQELADRGRLGPADFALPRQAETAGGVSGSGLSSSSSSRPVVTLAPTPVVLMLDMSLVGYVIGKQGRRIAELQRATGARVALAAQGSGLPGMRCGDRLLEVSGESEARREQGLRAVLAALAEAPSELGGMQGPGGPLVVLVPAGAVGYVIGKGGQSLREIMSRFGVAIELQQDGPPIAGARVASISGPRPALAEAALAIVAKVDELRARLADGASVNAAGAAAPFPSQNGAGQLAAATVAAPAAAAPARRGGGAPPSTCAAGPAATAFPPALAEGVADPTTSWPARTAAERALLAGIQASGVLNHQLSVRVPESLLSDADVAEVAQRSGARLEVGQPGADGAGPGHCFVTVVGQRVSTSLAALYLQEKMTRA